MSRINSLFLVPQKIDSLLSFVRLKQLFFVPFVPKNMGSGHVRFFAHIVLQSLLNRRPLHSGYMKRQSPSTAVEMTCSKMRSTSNLGLQGTRICDVSNDVLSDILYLLDSKSVLLLYRTGEKFWLTRLSTAIQYYKTDVSLPFIPEVLFSFRNLATLSIRFSWESAFGSHNYASIVSQLASTVALERICFPLLRTLNLFFSCPGSRGRVFCQFFEQD